MPRFEYQVQINPADAFSELVYFCTATGECKGKPVPAKQKDLLTALLNERGEEGWELAHLQFSQEGVLSVWKRAKKP